MLLEWIAIWFQHHNAGYRQRNCPGRRRRGQAQRGADGPAARPHLLTWRENQRLIWLCGIGRIEALHRDGRCSPARGRKSFESSSAQHGRPQRNYSSVGPPQSQHHPAHRLQSWWWSSGKKHLVFQVVSIGNRNYIGIGCSFKKF